MARIRTLKAEFFTSETVNALSSDRCRLTFAGLICTYVDDFGRGKDDPRLIKAAVWPLRDDLSAEDVAADLTELSTKGLIVRYDDTSSGRRGLRRGQTRTRRDAPLKPTCTYLALPSWREHQRVSHPSKSKYPPPPALSRTPPEDVGLFQEPLRPDLNREEKEEDLMGRGSARGRGKKSEPEDRVSPEGPNPNGVVGNISAEASALLAEAKAKTSRRTAS